MTMHDLDSLPVGAIRAKGDEPASALWTTHVPVATPGDCGYIALVARPHLQRRGANRSDQLHLPDLVACHNVLGQEIVSPIINALDEANDRWWRLELDIMATQMKVLRYGPGHHAPAHVDLYPGSMRRKLTMIVQLSDPSDYTGGDLELCDTVGKWWTIDPGRGYATVFPAWTPHRVTTIRTGERWTLAVWGYGAPIR